MVDRKFEYNVGVPAEDIELYTTGGYHPVHINDRFKDGRYEILNKLGFGSFSTVWLARDHEMHCNVSLKVVISKQSVPEKGELAILKHIEEKGDTQHPGRKHTSRLLDSFHHDGPNGQHLCIVSELLGPKVSDVVEYFPHQCLDSELARRISRQLLLAVDYLHACGVAHGDIHTGNILFRVPEFVRTSLEPIEVLGAPQIGEVSRKDGAPLGEGLPKYLVDPVEYDNLKRSDLDEIQLVDFGESFLVDSPPQSICTPLPMHPPELVFRHRLSKAVDLWNLGSTTYELTIGRPPFEAMFDDRMLIPQFQKVLGGLPVEWVLDAINDGVLKERPQRFSAEFVEPLEEGIKNSYKHGFDPTTHNLGDEDLSALGRYLRKMLVVDPSLRATTQELLQDPWADKPSDPAVANGTAAVYQVAATHADFADCVTMEIWNGYYKSRSDPREHNTVQVKTTAMMANGTHMVAHIYFDKDFTYMGHQLYRTTKTDKTEIYFPPTEILRFSIENGDYGKQRTCLGTVF